MNGEFLVRTGVWGELKACRSEDARVYNRGERVVCRTDRGLELGQVLGPNDSLAPSARIVRRMSDQDHLLQQRLEKYKSQALEQCRARLTDAGSDAVLLEVEQLFDGRKLYFHFLGQTDATVDAIIAELTDVYQANVRSVEFAQLLETGCGPDCGTPAAGPCNGACAGCVVAAACRNQLPTENEPPHA